MNNLTCISFCLGVIIAITLLLQPSFAESYATLTISTSQKSIPEGEKFVLSGKLMDRNWNPIRNSQIFIWENDGGKNSHVAETVTDANGEYRVSVTAEYWDGVGNPVQIFAFSSTGSVKSPMITINIEKPNPYYKPSTAEKSNSYVPKTSSSKVSSNVPSKVVSSTIDDSYKDHAYSIKQSHYDIIHSISSGITLSEDALSGLGFDNDDARKKIDTAWKIRWMAWSSHGEANEKLKQTELYLQIRQYKHSYNKLLDADKHLYTAKDDLNAIVTEIKEARDLEKQHQEKNRLCFLFWCSEIKNTYGILDTKIKDLESKLGDIESKLSKLESKKNSVVQSLHKYEIDQKDTEIQKLQTLSKQQELDAERQEKIKQQELAYQEQLQKEELERQERIKQQELAYKQQQIEWEEKNRILQLAVTNPRIAGIIDGTLRFYIDPVPYYAAPRTQKAVDEIADAFETHYLSGAKVERVYSNENANIVVQWVRDFGKSTLGHAVFKSYVEIELGQNNCNGDWMPYNPTSIKKVLWHELGHSVGYSHSNDSTNVMYYTTSPQFATEQKISKIVNDGWWQAWEICGSGPYYYTFSTSRTTDGFDIYVIPPETKPETFLKNSNALRYTDCGMKNRQSYSDTCNVKSGSYVFIYNYENHPIRLTGEITYIGGTSWPNMTWDKKAYQYNEAELNEIWNLFH